MTLHTNTGSKHLPDPDTRFYDRSSPPPILLNPRLGNWPRDLLISHYPPNKIFNRSDARVSGRAIATHCFLLSFCQLYCLAVSKCSVKEATVDLRERTRTGYRKKLARKLIAASILRWSRLYLSEIFWNSPNEISMHRGCFVESRGKWRMNHPSLHAPHWTVMQPISIDCEILRNWSF